MVSSGVRSVSLIDRSRVGTVVNLRLALRYEALSYLIYLGRERDVDWGRTLEEAWGETGQGWVVGEGVTPNSVPAS